VKQALIFLPPALALFPLKLTAKLSPESAAAFSPIEPTPLDDAWPVCVDVFDATRTSRRPR
jgi:hypothetical protein